MDLYYVYAVFYHWCIKQQAEQLGRKEQNEFDNWYFQKDIVEK